MSYNPYKDIQSVYNAKVAYGNATTDEEREKQNKIANSARKTLEAYGYGDIANQVSASGADAAAVKKVMDKWATVSDTVTGTYKSGVDNPAYNQSMTSASKKNDTYFDSIQSDRADVQGKYDDIYKYANNDVTETEEYKSSFKNIMPNYTLEAFQGRENELASGGASNGGNVDSFAAANALRQQAAITAKGQQLAHQMGLDAYNARVQNVRGILSDLGIYNQGTYDAMNQSIQNDVGIANTYFENEQTAKNNEVARLSEQAAVTGYVPKQWAYSNNPYFNSDGTLNEVYLSESFDNTGGFTNIINNAREKLKTTTDVTERANLEATINYATQAKAYKTLNNPQYAPYAHEVSAVTPQRTADYDLTKQQIESAEKIAKGDNDTKLTLADKEAAVTQQQINASLEAARLESQKDAYAGYNVLLSMWPVNEIEKRAFIEEHIKPLYESGTGIPEESLKQLILTNTEKYNIDVDDATKICQAYDVSTDWLSGYRDRTASDGNVTWYDGSIHEGQYGGMVKK